MLNKVILMGRLTHEPEFRQTQSGIPMCTFNIAIERPGLARNNERITDFFRVICWRSNAEFASKYFLKGSMVIVDGKIQNDNYTDQQGVKHYGFQINADNVTFGETRAAAQARGAVGPRPDEISSQGNYQGGYQGGGNYQAPPQNNYPRGGDGVGYSGFNQTPSSSQPQYHEPPVSAGSVEDFNQIISDGDVPF